VEIIVRVLSPQLWWTFVCFNDNLPRSTKYASIPFSMFDTIIDLFFPNFVNINVLTPFKHDVHVYVFTIMYMFLNYICTKYTKACIHQRIKPKTSWKHTKVLTTKPFQQLINKDLKVEVYHVWHEIILKIQTLTYIFFCKTYSNATNEKMIIFNKIFKN
jgi:hypothetical protein